MRRLSRVSAFSALSACVLAAFLALACSKKEESAPQGTATTAVPAGVRAVPITVDNKGFSPSAIDVKKGEKTALVFTRTSDDTCAKEVVFPEINVKKDLPLNTPVTVDVPSDAERTLTFQCGMSMFKSKVVIK